MLNRLPVKHHRRRLGGVVVRQSVPCTKAFLNSMDAFRFELKSHTGKSVSKSYLFREGAAMLMRQLRVQLTKALKGRLHAKVR